MTQFQASRKSSSSQKRKWASDDDAEDLLAGILTETQSLAAQEQQRIQDELRAREEQQRLEKEALEQRRKAEAEALIVAEMERLQHIEQRRTEQLQSLQRAKEEPVLNEPLHTTPANDSDEIVDATESDSETSEDTTPTVDSDDITRELLSDDDDENIAQTTNTAITAVPVLKPQRKINTKVLAILGGFLISVAVSTTIIAFLLNAPSYTLDEKAYPKAVFEPVEITAALATVEFVAVTKPEPEPPKVQTTNTRRRARTTKRAAPARRANPPARAPAKKTQQPKKNLDLDLNFDPFSSGL